MKGDKRYFREHDLMFYREPAVRTEVRAPGARLPADQGRVRMAIRNGGTPVRPFHSLFEQKICHGRGRTLMDETFPGMGLRPTGTEAGATAEWDRRFLDRESEAFPHRRIDHPLVAF